MDMVEPTLEMLQALMVRSLDGQADIKRELADMRREMGDVRGLTLGLSDKVERLDRKVERLERSINEVKQDMHDIKDDIWIMLKAELMGRQGNFETRVEARLAELADRLPPE
jgi:archaellum component FlaC